jgi:hypothetical protein
LALGPVALARDFGQPLGSEAPAHRPEPAARLHRGELSGSPIATTFARALDASSSSAAVERVGAMPASSRITTLLRGSGSLACVGRPSIACVALTMWGGSGDLCSATAGCAARRSSV